MSHVADMCEAARARGNECYAKKDYEGAIKMYTIAVEAAVSDEVRGRLRCRPG